jgi:hypothetical protein
MDLALPDARDKHTLVMGLGGGADVITAWALAQRLDRGAAGRITVANTKHELEPDLLRVSDHIGRVPPGPPPVRCRTTLDRALREAPLIVALPRTAPLEPLAAEVRALGCDQWIGVDTGGDVLVGGRVSPKGRDQRMLEVLRRTGQPGWLVVVAPGADGQTRTERMAEAMARWSPLGTGSVASLVPTFREFADRLQPHRTPRVVLDAVDRPEIDPVEVPRGCRPRVPRAWLVTVFLYAGGPATSQTPA